MRGKKEYIVKLPMLTRPRFLSFRTPALTTLLLCCSWGWSSAQSADGFTVQERPGIVLVKPQAWSKESDATVLEFEAYTDRTAAGGAAGYYELRTKASPKRQVPLSRVVKFVVYPNPQLIEEVVTPAEREGIQTSITELKTVLTRFPATRSYLTGPLKAMEDEAARFDSGRVKTGGQWITREAYVKAQADRLLDLLQGEISRALPPGSFDLENDPKFLALREYSQKDPTIKTRTDALAASYAKTRRTEKRKSLLSRLTDPALSLAEAGRAVDDLKAAQPAEDPRSAAFVKAWDAGTATVKDLSTQAAKLAGQIEQEMAAVKTEDVPPQLSPALDEQVSALNDKMRLFTATRPPPQFLTALKQAAAVGSVGTDFKKLTTIFTESQFLTAKEVLDPLSRQAAEIGPETSRVIGGLQRFAATKIDEFARLREEAKLLADSGKTADALAKYEAAFGVIPDPAVGQEIANLKPAEAAAPGSAPTN